MRILITTKIWKEGSHYIAYTPELDLSSQGKTEALAGQRLQQAIRLFFEETKRMGTFREVMEAAGFLKYRSSWKAPQISISSVEVAA